jgi:hypothetical protein
LNNCVKIISQNLHNLERWTIADPKIDELWRMTIKQTALMKVRIFGNK